jgi:hypothetical protein
MMQLPFFAPIAAFSGWRALITAVATLCVGLLYPASRSVAALEAFSPLEASR